MMYLSTVPKVPRYLPWKLMVWLGIRVPGISTAQIFMPWISSGKIWKGHTWVLCGIYLLSSCVLWVSKKWTLPNPAESRFVHSGVPSCDWNRTRFNSILCALHNDRSEIEYSSTMSPCKRNWHISATNDSTFFATTWYPCDHSMDLLDFFEGWHPTRLSSNCTAESGHHGLCWPSAGQHRNAQRDGVDPELRFKYSFL